MNSCHSSDCNYCKCVNAVAKSYTLSNWLSLKRLRLLWVCKRRSKVTHSQVDCHSHDCNYYECVNAGAKLHTRKSCDTQPIAPEWKLFLDWWVFLESLKLILMGINTCASLKIDLYRLEFCVRLKLSFGNFNIFTYKRNEFWLEFLIICVYLRKLSLLNPQKNTCSQKVKITSFLKTFLENYQVKNSKNLSC